MDVPTLPAALWGDGLLHVDTFTGEWHSPHQMTEHDSKCEPQRLPKGWPRVSATPPHPALQCLYAYHISLALLLGMHGTDVLRLMLMGHAVMCRPWRTARWCLAGSLCCSKPAAGRSDEQQQTNSTNRSGRAAQHGNSLAHACWQNISRHCNDNLWTTMLLQRLA